MDEAAIEPRTALWARAEVYWLNRAGTLCVTRGTLEDLSRSGACVRVDRAIEVGSTVRIKWHREQFSAVTKNCRSDGRDFLLGLRRETSSEKSGSEDANLASDATKEKSRTPVEASAPAAEAKPAAETKPAKQPVLSLDLRGVSIADLAKLEPAPALPIPAKNLAVAAQILSGQRVRTAARDDKSNTTRIERKSHAATEAHSPAASQSQPRQSQPKQTQSKHDRKRRLMESKSLFSRFARREGSDAADKTAKSAAASDSSAGSLKSPAGPKGDLLSYEDIYRAAGILDSHSGYDIGKVVEMLHCDRMRGLAEDVRRASVLMAIEAAGASSEDLLREATERERVLDAYEANQCKHLDEYEMRKIQENAQIEAELARVTAHYAARTKANLESVAMEKEALRNWQMAKQSESQRLAEVMQLCAKKSEREPEAMAAAAGGARSATTVSAGPSLVAGGTSTRPN